VSILDKIGKRPVAMGLGLALVAGHGLLKGFNSSGANQSFYELATGNPNIDKDILGTSINPANLMLNLPFSRTNVALHGLPGLNIGLRFMSPLGSMALPNGTARLIAATRTGFVNKKTTSAAFSRAGEPFSTTPNTFPSADGSLVFGLNNARHGG
jgi:hypothetical protein